MAGGEGAKERRRLKRLAAQSDGDKPVRTEKKRIPVKRNDARVKPVAKHQLQKKPFTTGAKAVGRFNNSKNSPKNGATSKLQTKSKKKNKPKKPKHLKRKLEQLGEENADEREVVLKKLNDWERTKEKFSFYKKNKNAHHSSDNDGKNAPYKENDDGAEEPKDFPRGGSSEDVTSNVPVVEPEADTPEKDTEPVTSKPDKDTKNEDSDSDDEQTEQRRQRGRRRRGRKDTAKQIAETTPVVEEAKSTPDKSRHDATANKEEKDEPKTTEIKKPKDTNRYCAGRKPVTDFVVGQRYTGKVVYVKPFGVFIDIGCHSDAFCHVSRLSDDYVESPETMYKEGDELNPRVVEIDRKQKKITVSLQSEAKIADEQKSIAARKERKESRTKKSKPKKSSSPKKDIQKDDSRQTPASHEKPATPQPLTEAAPKQKQSKPILPPDESTMTPAELKRARKLARRAARREQEGEEAADQ